MRIINSIEDLPCVIWNSQTAYIVGTYYGTPSNQSATCSEHRNEYTLESLRQPVMSYDLLIPRGSRYIRQIVKSSDVKAYVPFAEPETVVEPVVYGVKLVVANG